MDEKLIEVREYAEYIVNKCIITKDELSLLIASKYDIEMDEIDKIIDSLDYDSIVLRYSEELLKNGIIMGLNDTADVLEYLLYTQ